MNNNFQRIERLPPYVFNIIGELKSAARARGEDIIDFGMGNPDQATPQHIVDKLTETVQRGDTHRYSQSKGIPRLRRAICDWYQRRYDVTLDPAAEAIVTLGSKEGLAHLALATTSTGDSILVPNPSYPIHPYGFVISGADLRHVPMSDEVTFLEELEHAIRNSYPKPKMLVLNFPSNPTGHCVELEFFEKVRQQEPDLNGSAFLSGIIGDAWAGSLSIAAINSPQDLKYLYYSHGLNADSNVSLLPVKNHELLEQHFERERQYLKNDKYRIVAAMRCKLTLLCYLMRVPEHLGFRPWSPFLNQEIALDMLNISEGRKRKRQWQRDFFAKQGCDLEAKKLSVSNKNELNYLGMNIRPLQPLSIDLLREIIDPKYVEWINAQIGRETLVSRLKRWGLRTRNIRRILRACGAKNDRLQAYAAYLTLKPLENVISRRNEHYSAK